MAADEAAVLSNIYGLLDTLERQRRSMLASLDAKEVCFYMHTPMPYTKCPKVGQPAESQSAPWCPLY